MNKHAAYMMMNMETPSLPESEPFFEDEPLAELGFSFTTHVFGTHVRPFVDPSEQRGGPGLPIFGLYSQNWFNYIAIGYGSNSKYHRADLTTSKLEKDQADPFYIRDHWAVYNVELTKFASQGWWDGTVLSLGSEAIRIQPTRVGMRHYQKEHVASISRNPDGSVVKDNILDKFLLPTLIDVGSFESRQKMTDHETQRLAKVYEITEALSKMALTARKAGPANSPGSIDPTITARPIAERASSLLSDTDSDPEERIKVVPEIPPLWIR